MGYTHYWTYNPNEIKNTEELRMRFRAAVFIIKLAHKTIRHQMVSRRRNCKRLLQDQSETIRYSCLCFSHCIQVFLQQSKGIQLLK